MDAACESLDDLGNPGAGAEEKGPPQDPDPALPNGLDVGEAQPWRHEVFGAEHPVGVGRVGGMIIGLITTRSRMTSGLISRTPSWDIFT